MTDHGVEQVVHRAQCHLHLPDALLQKVFDFNHSHQEAT